MRIADILGAAGHIDAYTRGMTFEEFAADLRTVHAVIWNLVIVGEAATAVPAEIREQHAQIPWREMRAMRNFAVHEYFVASARVVWDTSQKDLPGIVPLLRGLLEDSP